MRHNVSWWQSSMFFDIFDTLRSGMDNAEFSARVEIDYIETSMEHFVEWFNSIAEHISGVEIKGQATLMGLTGLQEIKVLRFELLTPFKFIHQDLTLTPDDVDLSIFSTHVIDYEIEQLAYNHISVKASCWEGEIKEIRLVFERTIRQILKMWPSATLQTLHAIPDHNDASVGELPRGERPPDFGSAIHYKGNLPQLDAALKAYTRGVASRGGDLGCMIYLPIEARGKNNLPLGIYNVVFRLSNNRIPDGFYFDALDNLQGETTLSVMTQWLDENGRMQWLSDREWKWRGQLWEGIRSCLVSDDTANEVVKKENLAAMPSDMNLNVVGSAGTSIPLKTKNDMEIEFHVNRAPLDFIDKLYKECKFPQVWGVWQISKTTICELDGGCMKTGNTLTFSAHYRKVADDPAKSQSVQGILVTADQVGDQTSHVVIKSFSSSFARPMNDLSALIDWVFFQIHEKKPAYQSPAIPQTTPEEQQLSHPNLSVQMDTQASDEPPTSERKLRNPTRYRCTLVRNRVNAKRETFTDAIRAITLDHKSYKECERQAKFFSDAEMLIRLNGKTEEEAWEDEVNNANAL